MKEISLEFAKLNVKEEWVVESDDDLVSIYDPLNGCGAIQLSLFNVPKPQEANLQNELAEFVSDFLDYDQKEEIYSNSEIKDEYAFVELFTDERFWLFVCLRNNNNVIFITYNCEIEDKECEENEVWNVISSITFTECNIS